MLQLHSLPRIGSTIQVLKRFPHVAIPVRSKVTDATPDEILHFQQLAPTWWDTNGSQRVLHMMNVARLHFIRRVLNKQITIKDSDTYIPGFDYKQFFPYDVSHAVEEEWDDKVREQLDNLALNVLDVGCGGGILAESMGRMPFVNHVQGIDLTEDVIKVAKEHARLDPNLNGKVSYDTLAVEDVKGKYDIVTCFEMLEHVDRPGDILKHVWSRLKPEGVLFLSTINREPISWLVNIFVAENILKMVPKGTHHISKFVNSSEILEWFEKRQRHKFKVLDLKGSAFVPTRGWVEHDYPRIGNYFMAIKKRVSKPCHLYKNCSLHKTHIFQNYLVTGCIMTHFR
ncbi:hypothetical protein KAFR_0C01400 [Kazachstania africana CBS 2517]|uniref:Ubiquinone biosynthesis O-methyltransferase, mitochondrial n=1 Tax=Kazachstania africana (strain ATCC 22294 / BCRC 22015 / CBS 2517 / CECT 1963 / NBRC 1671 / NRRL Y-8276) TaxID=1071382 RepID=H2ARY3_KAZAF|nr:hypothetical protein KAFR_0C01400 [Kazachstania africana CBS 2517]CCF57133.1 hypothetical protein KAFR_0C01400 [Kazachstania africana CBS 2517]